MISLQEQILGGAVLKGHLAFIAASILRNIVQPETSLDGSHELLMWSARAGEGNEERRSAAPCARLQILQLRSKEAVTTIGLAPMPQ